MSRKRQCPKQIRLHRHCLDNLEIPISHPPSPSTCQGRPFYQVSPPACQTRPRACQVTPSAYQLRRFNCQDIDLSCQVRPTAYQIDPPACEVEYPTCQIRLPICQVKPPFCQLPPPACQNQTSFAMKHPISQWDQDFCTADTCNSKICRTCGQLPSPFCESSNDEDDTIMFSDCFGPCTKPEGGCQNVEENDLDHRSGNNNQQDKSQNEDVSDRTPVSFSNTPSRAIQNANTTPRYRNDEQTAQTHNIPHEKCVKPCQNKCFSDATGSENREMISNLNNNSAKINFRSIRSFPASEEYHGRNDIRSDINEPRIPQVSKEVYKIPEFDGNNAQFSDNADSGNLWETIPCCQPGYFQEQALQPNTLEYDDYFQSSSEGQSSSKVDSKIYQNVCNTSHDEMTMYPTRPYIENLNTDKNYKQSSFCDGREEMRPRIVASPYPRSAKKSLSNLRSRSGEKVHMQEPSNRTFMDCGTCCDISDSNLKNKVNNAQENISPDYGISSEFRSEHAKSPKSFAGQSGFENSVPIKGPKQFANCCNRGISKVIKPPEPLENIGVKTKDSECGKKEACVQRVGASSCASTTCIANETDLGCGCRYPPAYKQFSCAGNINGTCDCSDKSKF